MSYRKSIDSYKILRKFYREFLAGPSWIWGPTSKEREREERGGEGRRGKGRGGEGKGRGGSLRLCAEYIFFFSVRFQFNFLK